MIARLPSTRRSTSSLSTPFWNETTAVSPEMSGLMTRSFFRVPKLHAKDHEIDGGQLSGVIRSDDLREMEVAELAPDAQAVLPERLEHLATGDESHLRAALGEPSSEIAADAAGSHDRYPHRAPPFACRFIIEYIFTNWLSTVAVDGTFAPYRREA